MYLRNTLQIRRVISLHCSSYCNAPSSAQTEANNKNPLTKTCDEDGVRHVIMNHPKTRNALSLDMMTQLLQDITTNQDDPSLRCIVLSAEGPIFSAGHNLKELTSKQGTEYHKLVFATSSKLMFSILKAPVPVIAKVNGLATAAGCQLAATCDFAVCTDKSSFSTPGASVGIFCSTPGIALSRSVPRATAAYMLFTGMTIGAQEALRMGLVAKVVPEDKLKEEIDNICASIKSKSRSVVHLGKKFFYEQLTLDISSAYARGSEVMVHNLGMEDGQEGVDSFIEKRKPRWSHND